MSGSALDSALVVSKALEEVWSLESGLCSFIRDALQQASDPTTEMKIAILFCLPSTDQNIPLTLQKYSTAHKP